MILILCIARYNQSNKLFWTLFASFVGAFALTSVVLAANKPSKKNVNQVYSTQLCKDTSRLVETHIVSKDNEVFLRKFCPSCGESFTKISSDLEYFKLCESYHVRFFKIPGKEN